MKIRYIKQLLCVAAFLFQAVAALAQQGVVWETGSFQSVLDKAQAAGEGKMVFLDCHTSWCGPCKMMANKVFTTPEAGEYMNSRFLCIKIDMEKGEGVELHKQLGVKFFPTFIIFDAQGHELGRIIGGSNFPEFKAKLEKAIDPSASPQRLQEKFEQTKDMKYAYSYLEAMENVARDSEIARFVKAHYGDFPQKDKYSAGCWKYTRLALSVVEPEVLDQVMAHKLEYDARLGKHEVDEALYTMAFRSLVDYLQGEMDLTAAQIRQAAQLVALSPKGTYYETLVAEAAQAVAGDDLATLLTLFDARYLGFKLNANEYATAQVIFLKLGMVPDVEKARFYKETVKALNTRIEIAGRFAAPYKDVAVPDRTE